MKRMSSLLMSLFMLPVTAALPSDSCGVPNYDIQRYGNITITGYIKSSKTSSGKDTFYLVWGNFRIIFCTYCYLC